MPNRPLSPLRWLAALGLTALAAPPLLAENFAEVKPSPQQVAWQDLEFGVIVHFGTNTFLDREWGDGTASPKVFAPDQVDPAQWARASKAAGAKYLILVAKHHDGFALWPTEDSAYSVKNSPWLGGKGDLVKMTSEAVRKEGMGFGIYLSPWDRHEPKYADPKAYDKFYAAQLVDLASHYGPLTEWWLDGAGSAGHVYNFDKYMEELRTYQPNAMVFADTALFEYGDVRWVGNEAGVIEGENWNTIDRHGYLRWRPVEVDTPLHKLQWFWHPNSDQTLKSVDELVQIWEDSVGRGGQLVLGIAPDKRGLLPEADVKRLEEMGRALQARYGAGPQPGAWPAQERRRHRRGGGRRPRHVLERAGRHAPRHAGAAVQAAGDLRHGNVDGMAQRRPIGAEVRGGSVPRRRLGQGRAGAGDRPHEDRPLPRGHRLARAPEHPVQRRCRTYPRVPAVQRRGFRAALNLPAT